MNFSTSFPGPYEISLAVTVVGYTINEIYQLTHIQVPMFHTKIYRYVSSRWNILDLVCIFIFFLAFVLRFFEETLEVCAFILYALISKLIVHYSFLDSEENSTWIFNKILRYTFFIGNSVA